MDIVLELTTGERVCCNCCGKWVEAEKVYIYLDSDTKVYEVKCEACHNE